MNWLKANPDGLLRFVEVSDALRVDRSNFRKLRLHPDFLARIDAEGIEVDRPGSKARGFRYAAEEPPSESEFEDYFPTQDDEDTQAE